MEHLHFIYIYLHDLYLIFKFHTHSICSDDKENEDVEGADSAMGIYNKWAKLAPGTKLQR